MSAADDIFPKTKSANYVQTEWAGGWTYAVVGFGSAARMLTEQRESMHASVDQIGLAVFYLQRHRVELILKQALIDLGTEPADVISLRHNLAALWRAFGTVVTAHGAGHWRELDGRFGGFVAAMHDADEGSFSYRYPVNNKGAGVQRAPFIDLEALERYAEDFEGGIDGYLTVVYEEREVEAEMQREFEAEMEWEYGDDGY